MLYNIFMYYKIFIVYKKKSIVKNTWFVHYSVSIFSWSINSFKTNCIIIITKQILFILCNFEKKFDCYCFI